MISKLKKKQNHKEQLEYIRNLPYKNKKSEELKRKNILNYICLIPLTNSQVSEYFLKKNRLKLVNSEVTKKTKDFIESKEINNRSPNFINQKYVYEKNENRLYFGTENMYTYPKDKYTVEIYRIQYELLQDFYFAAMDFYYPEILNNIFLEENDEEENDEEENDKEENDEDKNKIKNTSNCSNSTTSWAEYISDSDSD